MSSSSSSTVSTTYVNGRQVISGLSSGIDVDSIIQKTLTAQKWKLYKLQQQQQLATWRQTAYREVISDIQAFADKYLSLTSASNILSAKNLQQFTTSSSNAAVTATAGATAAAGTHTLTVSRLATAASLTSSGQLAKAVQGTAMADFSAAAGKSFTIDLDGTKKTITLDATITDENSLQTAIDLAVGAGKVSVGTDAASGALVFQAVAGSGVQKLTLSGSSALSDLGFGDGAILTNRISTSDTLETIAGRLNTELTFDNDGLASFTINGVDFSFDKSATLSEVMTEVNGSTAGATLSYNQLTGKLSLTATETGAGNTLAVGETGGNFLSALLDQSTAGVDARLTLDGVELTRSSNAVTVDGITYNLRATTSETVTIGVARDTEAIYATISSFVDAYNTLIDSINSKLSETYDRDYPPLTDDQKAEMTEAEIASWEAKAKVGLLANDSLLQNMLTKMRTALTESVSGVTTSLAKIGITTSAYSEKGKLHIDTDKLKAAIEDDPDGVASLFTQSSTSYSGTTAVRKLSTSERSVRYKEEGLAYRLYDIIQDNISTLRDSGGNKGLMLEKAGTANDTSETDNWYSDALKEYNKKIAAEQEWLDAEEERLYNKYSVLETYLNTLTAQFTALSSMLGTGS